MTDKTKCPLCDSGQIELVGIDGARLLAAFQVLRYPSGFLGARHSDAVRCIKEVVGVTPVGKPKDVETGAGLEPYIDWICANHRTGKKRHSFVKAEELGAPPLLDEIINGPFKQKRES